MVKKLFFVVSFPLFAHLARAQEVDLLLVTGGLPDIVDIAHAGDDRLFCVLQPGLIRIVQNETLLPDTFLNIVDQVDCCGEKGLLGLAFDPDFTENGSFYVHYTAPGGSGITTVSRFRVSEDDPNAADPDTEEIIFTYPQPFGNHNGGDLEFGPDGYLYISLGDGGGGGDTQNNAQNVTNPLGALLRIDVSEGIEGYSIPPTNPFANAGGDTLPEIFVHGLRNPWRIGFDDLTGDLWIGDVGQNAWEEIDHWPAGEAFNGGANFGWRCYEGLEPYNTNGCGPISNYVMPVVVQPNTPWCSIVGGRVYRGSEFPSLYGRYYYTDYCVGAIHALSPSETGFVNEMLLPGQGQDFTVIAEDHMLELYLGKKNSGQLYRLVDPLNVAVEGREELSYSAYPVPAQERLILEGRLEQVATIQLFDHFGRVVSSRGTLEGRTRIELDVSTLAVGAYVLLLRDQAGQEIGRRMISVVH